MNLLEFRVIFERASNASQSRGIFETLPLPKLSQISQQMAKLVNGCVQGNTKNPATNYSERRNEANCSNAISFLKKLVNVFRSHIFRKFSLCLVYLLLRILSNLLLDRPFKLIIVFIFLFFGYLSPVHSARLAISGLFYLFACH